MPFRLVLSLFFCLFFAGHAHSASPGTADGFAAAFSRGTPAPASIGFWRSRGYGYLLDISAQGIRVYDEADDLCWPDLAVTEGFPAEMPRFRIENVGREAVFANGPESTDVRFDRLEALPSICRTQAPATPERVFDALWATMDEHYAFFAQRGVDWRERRQRYRPLAASAGDDAALFEVLLQSLDGINDAHLSLRGEIDGQARGRNFGRTPSLTALRAPFDAQTRWRTTTTYYHAWVDADLARINVELLGGNARSALDGKLLWGTTADNIGYLAIRSMQGFGKDSDAARDLALLVPALDRAIAELEGARAMIVDVTQNLGGADQVGLLIASRFADQRRHAYSKRAWRVSDAHAQGFYVQPGGPLQFRAPVYLLTSDLTASAAEVFVLVMRALPQVTQVGGTTRGVFSDILSKTLPNGWRLGLSNEIYVDAEGASFEGTGLSPARPFPVFVEGQMEAGHLEVLRRLAADLR